MRRAVEVVEEAIETGVTEVIAKIEEIEETTEAIAKIEEIKKRDSIEVAEVVVVIEEETLAITKAREITITRMVVTVQTSTEITNRRTKDEKKEVVTSQEVDLKAEAVIETIGHQEMTTIEIANLPS